MQLRIIYLIILMTWISVYLTAASKAIASFCFWTWNWQLLDALTAYKENSASSSSNTAQEQHEVGQPGPVSFQDSLVWTSLGVCLQHLHNGHTTKRSGHLYSRVNKRKVLFVTECTQQLPPIVSVSIKRKIISLLRKIPVPGEMRRALSLPSTSFTRD